MAVAGQRWIAGVNEVLYQIRRYGHPYVCSFPGFPNARWKCDLAAVSVALGPLEQLAITSPRPTTAVRATATFMILEG
jgi:hypothetical protein